MFLRRAVLLQMQLSFVVGQGLSDQLLVLTSANRLLMPKFTPSKLAGTLTFYNHDQILVVRVIVSGSVA